LRHLFSILLAITSIAAVGCRANGDDEPVTTLLKPLRTIALDGVEGRIDHLAIDAKNNRLYVAALGNDTVEVIDTAAGKRVLRIEGLKKPQGIAVLGDLGRIAVASGEDGKCRFYDSGKQKLLGTIDALDDADNVRYDAAARLVYVGYGDGALAVIDAQKMTKVADIKLEGHPESFQLEQKGARIFVNVPSAKQVAVVDRGKRQVVAKWPLSESANFPMALDEANHRLFVGCRKPAKVVTIDVESGKTVAAVDTVGDTDDLFYDATNRRLYVSGGEGRVAVIEQTAADHYRNAGSARTAAGARTSLFDQASRVLYVAAPHRDGHSATIHVFGPP
jgi:YVTN family beta-propeller protein